MQSCLRDILGPSLEACFSSPWVGTRLLVGPFLLWATVLCSPSFLRPLAVLSLLHMAVQPPRKHHPLLLLSFLRVPFQSSSTSCFTLQGHMWFLQTAQMCLGEGDMAVTLHTTAGGLNSEVGRGLSLSTQVRAQDNGL